MPIYEFYCPNCHVLFSFFSRRVDTEKRPACPRCRRPEIERRMSPFAISRRREADEAGLPADLDEARLEKAMSVLAREAEGFDDEDPRQAARFMKRLSALTGLSLGEGMEEALHRLEAGEDPDEIEADLGEVLEGGDAMPALSGKTLLRRILPPARDDKLYDL
jgi:putative FmdB family regulatory protein